MREQKPGDKSVKLEEAVSSGLHKAPVLPVLSAVCRGLGYSASSDTVYHSLTKLSGIRLD